MRYLLFILIFLSLVLNPQTASAQKSKSKKARTKKSAPAKTPAESPAPAEPAPAPELAAPAAGSATAKVPRPKRESISFLFASFSWIWFQEPLELIAPSGNRYAMVTTANGPCFGAGWKKVKPTYEWSFQGCFFSAGNEVGAVVTDIGYYQQGVESYGVIIGPGIMTRPAGGSVAFGIQVPAFFRYAQWTLPPQAGYDVDGTTRITGGVLLEANWTAKRLTLGQKIGAFYKTGSLWALQLNFRF